MMGRTLTRLLGAVLLLVAAPFAAAAQQPGKIWRIGFLGPPPSSTWGAHLVQAFQQGLEERGYRDGQNISIEYRSTEDATPERLALYAAELVQLRVDVLVVSLTSSALAAKNATRTIPIVFVNVPDPVAQGLVASLAKPGGNITGTSTLTTELMGKQMALLKEAIPKVSRVGVLWNPLTLEGPAQITEAQTAAKSLGLQLLIVEAAEPRKFDGAFSTMVRNRVHASFIVGSGLYYIHASRLADIAVKHRLPTMFGITDQVAAGGLIAYGWTPRENYRRAAAYVDKLLKGARPSDLPVEQPSKFELVINVKTAKALGLTIPQSMLLRADRLIE
jgi:putative ABC transport system substrate-binding protein